MLKWMVLLLINISNIASGNWNEDNILVYNQGDIQVRSNLNAYDQLVPGVPLIGSVMITRGSKDKVDPNSFTMGKYPLKVDFIGSQPLSSYDGSLIIDIYRFESNASEVGNITLPPISVKINGHEYTAPPLSIVVNNPS